MARRKTKKKWGKIGAPGSAKRRAHLSRIRRKGKATKSRRRRTRRRSATVI